MSEAKKPEWFEIVESDQPVQRQQIKRAHSFRKVAAVAVTGVVIGAGALIANAGEESPASAETTVSTSAIAPVAAQANTQAPSAGNAGSVPVAPANPRDAIKNPLTQGARGDDDDSFEDQDHDRRGDHEFRGHDDDESDGDFD